jgi:hypothetical protein
LREGYDNGNDPNDAEQQRQNGGQNPFGNGFQFHQGGFQHGGFQHGGHHFFT